MHENVCMTSCHLIVKIIEYVYHQLLMYFPNLVASYRLREQRQELIKKSTEDGRET